MNRSEQTGQIVATNYAKEARAAAKAFCREHGIPFGEYGADIAKQFEHDYRRNDELRAMAEGRA